MTEATTTLTRREAARKAETAAVIAEIKAKMAEYGITLADLGGVPVAHVEGGIRSGDWTMPEEINRVVRDSITNWFFTTSKGADGPHRHVHTCFTFSARELKVHTSYIL